MRVHDTLEPLRGLRADRRELIETGRLIGDGGYSRVIAFNAFSVLKLTCCKQTQQLLDGLHKLPPAAHPQALPAVLDRWGPVAEDADGHRFIGYVVERLYPEDSTAERLRGKRLGETVIGARRQLAPSSFQVRLAELRALEDVLDAARARCLHGERPAQVEHLTMAEQLSVMRLAGGMERTFGYLADFLRRSQGELDLFQRGNILLDCMGHPMLADPVAEMTSEPVEAGPAQTPSGPEHALVARSVTALQGLHAIVEWDTVSLSADLQALESAQAELLATPGTVFETRVLPLGSTEHRKLISEGRQQLDVWSLPLEVRRQALHPR